MSVQRGVLQGALLVAIVSAQLVATPAFGQAHPAPIRLPQGTTVDTKVTTGITTVFIDRAAAADLAARTAKDATELSLSIGALAATGNARQLSLTGSTRFRVRREDDQITASAATNYAEAAKMGERPSTTVENTQGLMRYDRFFQRFALFTQLQGRSDRFQGLAMRLQASPGGAYYLVSGKAYQLWLEAGYDLLLDVRRPEARVVRDASGNPVIGPSGAPERLPKTQLVHSLRFYLGYEATLSSGAKLNGGVEYLQGLAADTEWRIHATETFRLNFVSSVQATVWKALALSLAFTGRYDNAPLPGKRSFDTLTSAGFVYTFF